VVIPLGEMKPARTFLVASPGPESGELTAWQVWGLISRIPCRRPWKNTRPQLLLAIWVVEGFCRQHHWLLALNQASPAVVDRDRYRQVNTWRRLTLPLNQKDAFGRETPRAAS